MFSLLLPQLLSLPPSLQVHCRHSRLSLKLGVSMSTAFTFVAEKHTFGINTAFAFIAEKHTFLI